MSLMIFFASLLLISAPSVFGKGLIVKQPQQSAVPILQVSIVPKKLQNKLSDQLRVRAMVENLRYEDIYILNAMEFGHFGSFALHVLDSSGRQIQPAVGFHALPTSLPVDNSQLVRLQYSHFLGSEFWAPLEVLSVRRPGRYGIFVEYQSPISERDVSVKPFWGSEKGPIKSEVVWIEVRR
jgi:hypothetical protein